jgi:hypothetical protein
MGHSTVIKNYVTDHRTGESFGSIEILGVVGKNRTNKVYAVLCTVCAENPIYEGGIFTSMYYSLAKGIKPCGCSPTHKLSENQMINKLSKIALERGYTFLGFSGQYKNQKSTIKLNCEIHGVWNTTQIGNFINVSGLGCPKCGIEHSTKSAHAANQLTDEQWIAKFLATGKFSISSKFKRLDKSKWESFCPVCEVLSESDQGELSRGRIPCKCARSYQTYAYIHQIESEIGPIALKFGVSVDPKTRLLNQKSKTIFTVSSIKVFRFPDKLSCFKAEKQCKNILGGPVLSKLDFPDGWSETVLPNKLIEIMNIYKSFNGVEV